MAFLELLTATSDTYSRDFSSALPTTPLIPVLGQRAGVADNLQLPGLGASEGEAPLAEFDKQLP